MQVPALESTVVSKDKTADDMARAYLFRPYDFM